MEGKERFLLPLGTFDVSLSGEILGQRPDEVLGGGCMVGGMKRTYRYNSEQFGLEMTLQVSGTLRSMKSGIEHSIVPRGVRGQLFSITTSTHVCMCII